MTLDKCPKCDGTNIILDHKKIREIVDVDLSPLTVVPGMDDFTAYCFDCRSLTKIYTIELPGKESILEMCRRLITDHDPDYYLEKKPQEG